MDSARVTRVSAEQIPLVYPRGCAAPPRGITLIATLERFVYCSSELVISGRAPGRSPEGTGNCSSCYGYVQEISTSPLNPEDPGRLNPGGSSPPIRWTICRFAPSSGPRLPVWAMNRTRILQLLIKSLTASYQSSVDVFSKSDREKNAADTHN